MKVWRYCQFKHRPGYQAARKGRDRNLIPRREMVCSHCAGFSTYPVLSHSDSPNSSARTGEKRAKIRREWRCALKSQEPVPFTFHLPILPGKLYAARCSGVPRRFFGQKSDFGLNFGAVRLVPPVISGFKLRLIPTITAAFAIMHLIPIDSRGIVFGSRLCRFRFRYGRRRPRKN